MVHDKLILIGYWASEDDTRWPDPRDFVNPNGDPNQREEVARYLRAGIVVSQCMGFSPCRICGKENGSQEFTDGVYVWPEGLAHYVEDHNIVLPPEFNAHALDYPEALFSVDRSTSWWAAQKGKSQGH